MDFEKLAVSPDELNLTEHEITEKYKEILQDLQEKAKKAFQEAGVPFTRFTGETDQNGFYRIPVSVNQAHPIQTIGLLAKLVEAFDPKPGTPIHRVLLQYYDGERQEPYDMYLATYPGKLGIVFIGLSRSEVRELLKQEKLAEDPKEAFDQVWKRQTQDGWYSYHYDQDHHIGYIMHESQTLKLRDFYK